MSLENIFLMGFMSSGKSKIGRQIAKKLNREFIDLDQRIEEESGKTIPQIFEDDGEEAFRALESKALKAVKKDSNLILALGGGTPCFSNNLKHIKKLGRSFYLKVDSGILIGRLKQNAGKRPLLKDLSNEQLSEYVQKTLSEREEYYLRADHVLDDNNPTPAKIIQLLKLS